MFDGMLDVVIDSVEDGALLNHEHAKVFKQHGERVYGVCELTDLFAAVLRVDHLHLLLLKHLRLVQGRLYLRRRFVPVELLHLDKVVFF